jgi:hypothetical protein
VGPFGLARSTKRGAEPRALREHIPLLAAEAADREEKDEWVSGCIDIVPRSCPGLARSMEAAGGGFLGTCEGRLLGTSTAG